MTATEPAAPGSRPGTSELPPAPARPGPRDAPPRTGPGAARWLALHQRSLLVLFGALVVTGAAMAWNLQGLSGRANDDEGTYVARPWCEFWTVICVTVGRLFRSCSRTSGCTR